jgi:hypothetical protein
MHLYKGIYKNGIWGLDLTKVLRGKLACKLALVSTKYFRGGDGYRVVNLREGGIRLDVHKELGPQATGVRPTQIKYYS